VQRFPNIRPNNYIPASPESEDYNCIAWAVGDEENFWWPHEDAYWPKGVERRWVLETFIEAFGTVGFRVCESGEVEEGFDKIAIYADDMDRPQHAAKQLQNGKWSSKMGRSIDADHELSALEGPYYGHVKVYMKRPLSNAECIS